MASHGPDFVEKTVALTAYVLNELITDVSAIAASIDFADDELREQVTQSLDELHTLTTRMKEAFPPPSGNGWPPPSS
jgi:tRNA U34 5-carboxymethylaminomethyl modifying GTPase MnmE/TrmE